MIDLDSRRRAAELLAAYLSGATTADEFEAAWGTLTQRSTDSSLKPIGWAAWCTYDDVPDHQRDSSPIDARSRSMLERCIQFLKQDEEYRWNTPSPRSFSALLKDQDAMSEWPFRSLPPTGSPGRILRDASGTPTG